MLKPDVKLLRDHGTSGEFGKWKEENGLEEGKPYCLKFTKGEYNLNYIGTNHTNDPKSDTYKLVGNVIKKSKPKLVVIEGVQNSYGLFTKIETLYGEIQYAAKIAQKYDIDIIGIESDEVIIFKHLTKKMKFKRCDIYGFLFLRTQNVFYHSMKAPRKDFLDAFYKHEKPYLDKAFGSVLDWDHRTWYKKTFGVAWRYSTNKGYSHPYCAADAVITQKIACAYSRMRDEMNIKILYSLLNKYKKVVYVMGQNHVYADVPVLENTFGKFSVW